MRRPLVLLAIALLACQTSVPPAAAPSGAPQRAVNVLVIAPPGVSTEGSTVCAFTISGRQERCGETNASGRARLAVPPGTYAVRVTPKAGTRLGAAQTWSTAVDADDTAVLELKPLSRISGTVRDDRGVPVAGADVCAHPPSTAPPTCGKSDAKGAYSIEITSDVYKLEISGPVGAKLIAQWARGRVDSSEADVIDARGADVQGIDIALIHGFTLTGIVRGPGGPLEGAQVCLRTLAAPLPWDCERTKKDGTYVALLEPGRYYLWTVPPDNVRAVAQWYDHVLEGVDTTEIAVDRDRSIDVTLDPGPQIHGTVRTSDGAPVAGALVCVDTPFPTGRICRPTSPDGSYQVTTRPANYVVQVIPPASLDLVSEYWSGKRAWNEADWVTLGNADRTLDLVLRRGDRVSGIVRDTRGIPIEGATININDDRGPLVGSDTDISGTYSVVVPRGHYQIEVFAPRVSELLSQTPRDLDTNGFTRMDFVLEDARP